MNEFWSNGQSTIHLADARDIPLPDQSVHVVVTSPPYWGIRDYGIEQTPWDENLPGCQHQWEETTRKNRSGSLGESALSGTKMQERRPEQNSAFCKARGCEAWLGSLGSEPTIRLYVKHIVHIFREIGRVLRDDGTAWVNLGDTHNSGTNAGRNPSPKNNVGYWNTGGQYGDRRAGTKEVKIKDLTMTPFRAAIALQEDGWYVRQVIIWRKLNGLPDPATDRPGSAHEYIFLLSKSPRYFYDQEAVKLPASGGAHARRKDGQMTPVKGKDPNDKRAGTWVDSYTPDLVKLRSVWDIAVQGSKEAHFATFPERIPEIAILCGTSEKGVCQECGTPMKRVKETGDEEPEPVDMEILEDQETGKAEVLVINQSLTEDEDAGNPNPGQGTEEQKWEMSCGHGAGTTPPVVFDPFAGSGTTLKVAQRLGRISHGCEVKEEYALMAKRKMERTSLPLFRAI